MANLTFDFLHNYVTGERRASDPADAYQYDEGHVLEAVVPVAVTSCEIQYWIRGMEKADAYTPTSITQNTDNTYTILGNVPNSYFETCGDLRVYIVVTDGDASITTYEGYIHIKERQMPEDYVDDDPDNEAVRVIAEARAAASTATEKAGEAAESAEQAQEILDSIPEDYSQLSEDVSNLKDDLYNTLVTETASGSIASFSDGADNVPVKSLTVAIEPIQAGSGDPSPTNIRPISGHTSAVVTRTGVNVWDEEWEIGNIDPSTGQDTSSRVRLRSKNYISAKPNTSYFMCVDVTQTVSWLSIFFYDANKDFLSVVSPSKNNAFTTPANTAYMRFIIPDGWGGADYVGGISINYPSTDHDYHEGHVQTVTIDLNGAVYGGTLDVTTGVLTVDRAIVDLGTLDWTLDIDNVFICGIIDNIVAGARNANDKSCICEKYAYIGIDYQSALSNNQFIKSITSKTIRIRDTSYSDATAFKASLSNVHMVYQIAEPQTIQLTAQEVRTLLGQNNVFADAGDVSVEYRADTKLYIQKVISG